MKIALLICDELADCLKPRFGDYKIMFEKLLNHPVLAYDARKMEFPAEETLDGIIISGSRSSVLDKDEWISVLKERVRSVILENRTPLVGICFGHQIIASCLDDTLVERNQSGWEVGFTEMSLSSYGSKLFSAEKVFFHSFHKDHVVRLPLGFHLVGGNSHTAIQIMTNVESGGMVLSIQAHPEFTQEYIHELVRLRSSQNVISASFVAHVESCSHKSTDSLLFASKILLLFQQKRL